MNILLKVVLFLMGEASSRWVFLSVCPFISHTFLQISKIYVCDVIMYIFSHQLALRVLFATLWLMKLKIRKSAYLKNG